MFNEMMTYNPFGRMGAGAPLRDEVGNINASRYNQFNVTAGGVDLTSPYKISSKAPDRETPIDPSYGAVGNRQFGANAEHTGLFTMQDKEKGYEFIVGKPSSKTSNSLNFTDLFKDFTPEELQRLEKRQEDY